MKIKEKQKIELLAPAGNREAFYGAVHAGADAIYLGGEKFGARAYADNFTREELLECIRYGHIHGCRSYLTVNTLMKEQELSELLEELSPLYEEGLDGVIVQDLGALQVIRQHFPELELHASTQMTITGPAGASLLKELGVNRVVPARELSLEEIRQLKQESGLEVEAFIHGAMCYCYSGACLFSSILGGRSGNRGRCAQPCRLAYETDSPGASVHKKEYYPLSLKDMCTIENLPQLMESGIDSLKIEGRMKKSEYAAGVTAIYRKYIDRYLSDPLKAYAVEKQDLEALSKLYIRSQRQTGYYFRQNGREMVTLESPSYSGSDEAYLGQIRQKYIEEKKKIPIRMKAVFVSGLQAKLQMEQGNCLVVVEGQLVEPAQNRPVTQEDIRKQLQKLGESCFALDSLEIETDGKSFYSLKEINALRREAVRLLEDRIIEENGLVVRRIGLSDDGMLQDRMELQNNGNLQDRAEMQADGKLQKDEEIQEKIRLQVSTREQLLYLAERYGQEVMKKPVKEKTEDNDKTSVVESVYIDRVYIESYLLKQISEKKDQQLENALMKLRKAGIELWMALPYILRSKDMTIMERASEQYRKGIVQGFLVRNLEEYGWLKNRAEVESVQKDAGVTGNVKSILQQIQMDHTVYIWNSKAADFWRATGCGLTCPLELNAKESHQLIGKVQNACGKQSLSGRNRVPDDRYVPIEKMIYGRIPMMVTANCIARTADKCLHGKADRSTGVLTDRYRKKFPVEICCDLCMNIIYNSVPLSLHKEWNHYAGICKRLVFTTENRQDMKQVLDFFQNCDDGKLSQPPYEEFTTGHEKRGVL